MRWLERYWYRISPLHLVLWPLSLVFGGLVALRRSLYRTGGLLKSARVPVPVIVAGNITVGGTGKTPLVIWLAGWLREHGCHPGVVCRGYGGSANAPQRAAVDSDPGVVGDEAVLLARRCGCPVWVGARRVAAVRALLAAHPECDTVISDDGLQHYSLARDIEIAVIDGERGFGNGMLLPAGPLREPLRRLERVEALVVNGAALFPRAMLPFAVPALELTLGGSTFYNLLDPARQVGPERFARQQVDAVAAIGNPGRFFGHLRALGISFVGRPFPDHHVYAAADFAGADVDAVLMTEKDAVKCERLGCGNFWALRIDAKVDPALGELILRKLGKQDCNGP